MRGGEGDACFFAVAVCAGAGARFVIVRRKNDIGWLKLLFAGQRRGRAAAGSGARRLCDRAILRRGVLLGRERRHFGAFVLRGAR